MQKPQLLEYQEQKDDDGEAGTQEILPQVPQAPGASGNQVNWEMPGIGA
jgi:hypothetical protein